MWLHPRARPAYPGFARDSAHHTSFAIPTRSWHTPDSSEKLPNRAPGRAAAGHDHLGQHWQDKGRIA